MDVQTIEKIFRAGWLLRLVPLAEDCLLGEPDDTEPSREHTEIFQLLRVLWIRRIDRQKSEAVATRGEQTRGSYLKTETHALTCGNSNRSISAQP